MMKKIKSIVFVILLILFIVVLFQAFFGTNLSYLSSKEIKKFRKLNYELIDKIKINNVDALYDECNNIYYYMVPEHYENKRYVLRMDFNDNFKYKIIGETLNVVKVDYNKAIKVIIYNDKYYYETKIKLVNLPLVSIETENSITTNDTNSKFKYINIKNSEKVVENNIKIHVRGATSQYLPKKSYKINFYNKEYTKEKKVNISDFYYGDSFILDALYRDDSKIRNVLSTELWNDVSSDFTNVDVKSEFVELFINKQYKGLYLLTEPINRTNLNLNKSNIYDTSIVVKSTTNVGYEVKYPNDEDFIPEVIEKLNLSISDYFDGSKKKTYDLIKRTWNLENYIDIIIFNYFINNVDNRLEQNVYYYANSMNDELIYIQPWDMEFSLGIMPTIEGIIKLDSNRFDCVFFHSYAPEINKLLIDRYWELRKTILTKKYFDDLLDKYENDLTKGAALRDSETWNEYDVEQEIEYIRKWIYDRLDYLDEYIVGLQNEQS